MKTLRPAAIRGACSLLRTNCELMDQSKVNPASARQMTLDVETELNESRLALLMNDASIDQILALDLALNVRAWNKACEDVTGIARAQAIGKPFYEVRVGAEAFSEIAEALQMALRGFKSFLPWEKRLVCRVL